MMTQKLREFVARLFGSARAIILLILVIILYLLPLNSRSEFIQHNRQIVEISKVPPILKSIYPEGAYATCGDGGTGTNCQTGCCSAGACVVCPPEPDDQPPSIFANLNCSNPGNDNWCIGTLSIDLSASDPQGASMLITGSINGNNFACPVGATSCSIPITEEGPGAIAYRVDASTGLSASGSASYKLDATTPILNGSINGVQGANSWYRSNVTLTVSSNDSLSGVAFTMASLNGGTPFSVNGPLSFSDGISNVVITATDYAGNSTQTTQTIKVDTITPSIGTTLNGTSGANGWYVSMLTITPSAGDAGSGLASLEISTDGNAYTAYTTPVTFLDGVHTYKFRATDNADNVTETTPQTVKVDTTTPLVGLNINGTKGSNGWYISNVTVAPTTSDATSTVGLIEAVFDSGSWNVFNSPLSFTNGLHTYQFRVTDQAGNSTITPLQNLKIDTLTPAIDMTAEISLGETVYYALEDYGSGLSIYRAVIEDDDEQYQKVVWLDVISGNKLQDQIRWDGKFNDGTQAGWGKYFITLKISDVAGNETMKSAVVTVNPFSFLQELPAFVPPANTTSVEISLPVQTDDFSAAEFGGENNNNPVSEAVITTNEGGAGVTWPHEMIGEVNFSIPSSTTSNSMPLDSNILWGVAATALAGAALAEWERQREEERKRQEAEEAMQQKRENTERRQSQWAQEEAVRERWAQEAAEERYLQNYNQHMEDKMAEFDAMDDAKWTASQIAIQKQRDEERQRQNEVAAARWAGIAAIEQAKQEEEEKHSWWSEKLEEAWDWAYNNQIDLSLGTGVVMGAAATVAIVTGVITAPAWLIVVGAVLLTGAIVTAGTLALNNHFGQDWHNNLVSNLIAGGVATLVTSGVGLLLASATSWVSTTIVATCINYPTVCYQVQPILDHGEESVLSVQLIYYKWKGDEEGVITTMIELQMEAMDGGVPGNSLTHEVSEQLSKLGPDAWKLVGKYGSDVVPLLLKYGDNAVKVLNVVDLKSAPKLLDNLDADVLEYALNEGPDAVVALSRWSDSELKEFGVELALRAKKDAKVLEDIRTLVNLGPMDPKHPTIEQQKLINSIAEYSMQYSDEGQIVLGKWVDYGNGFTYIARETGSVHYNPHPDMWNLFGELGDDLREDTAWLVNKQVIQNGIDKGLPFEYTLEDIPVKDVLQEKEAVEMIFAGKTDAEIMKELEIEYISIRWKELQELQKAGYDFVFDEKNNSFILDSP